MVLVVDWSTGDGSGRNNTHLVILVSLSTKSMWEKHCRLWTLGERGKEERGVGGLREEPWSELGAGFIRGGEGSKKKREVP